MNPWEKQRAIKKIHSSRFLLLFFAISNTLTFLLSFLFFQENAIFFLFIPFFLLNLLALYVEQLYKYTLILNTAFYLIFLIFKPASLFLVLSSVLASLVGAAHFLDHLLPIRIPKWILFLIPFLLFGQVLIYTLDTEKGHIAYTLNFGTNEDTNPTKNIYISSGENILSPRQRYGDETFRLFEKTGEIQITFVPPKDAKGLYISADIKSENPVYINEELLYHPHWKELQALSSTETFILEEENTDRDNISLEQFISENYPHSQIYVPLKGKEFMRYIGTIPYEEYIENLDKYEAISEPFTINTSFRGPVLFKAYYNQNEIFVTLTKKDLNIYEGDDIVRLRILNSQEEEIASFEMPDDGTNNSNSSVSNNEQQFSFKTNISTKGLYTLSFEGVQNRGEDFEIANITTNTNKIMSIGRVYIREAANLYFKGLGLTKVLYWHDSAEQTLTFSSGKNLTLLAENKKIPLNISLENETTLEVPKGNIILEGDENMALAYSNESYFPLYFSPEIRITLEDKDSKLDDKAPAYLKINDNYTLTIQASQGTKINKLSLEIK
ncbi:MAG: hypothetical protein KC548_03895 [Nanoarchaeota archaeon]|nr:hypothetical protein [Nanoarchaeota archaeon]